MIEMWSALMCSIRQWAHSHGTEIEKTKDPVFFRCIGFNGSMLTVLGSRKWELILLVYVNFYCHVQHLILYIILNDLYNNVQHVFMALGNDRRNIFTHGAWSDSHGVLGVIDDMNTLFFIKSNEVEITRMTKRQLKTTAHIIGVTRRPELIKINSN